jgi:hypothetical protein
MAGGSGPFPGQAGAPIDMDIGCIGEDNPGFRLTIFLGLALALPLPLLHSGKISVTVHFGSPCQSSQGRSGIEGAQQKHASGAEIGGRAQESSPPPSPDQGLTCLCTRLAAQAKLLQHATIKKRPRPSMLCNTRLMSPSSTGRSKRRLAEGELPRQG